MAHKQCEGYSDEGFTLGGPTNVACYILKISIDLKLTTRVVAGPTKPHRLASDR